tara:strand:+ start:740 stop:1006 length:267 start_codon:yes stop_codon:yes gene_type:complete
LITDFSNKKNLKLEYNSIVKNDYKIQLKNCEKTNKILEKLEKYEKLNNIFPKKSLRTSVMLLNFEDKFTIDVNKEHNFSNEIIFPYYQ